MNELIAITSTTHTRTKHILSFLFPLKNKRRRSYCSRSIEPSLCNEEEDGGVPFAGAGVAGRERNAATPPAPPSPPLPPPRDRRRPLPPLLALPAVPAAGTAAALWRGAVRRDGGAVGADPGARAGAALHGVLPVPPRLLQLPPQRPPAAGPALLGARALRRRRRPEDRPRGVPRRRQRPPRRPRRGLAVREPRRRAALRAPLRRPRRAQVEAPRRLARRLLPPGGRHRRLPPRRAARQVHVSEYCSSACSSMLLLLPSSCIWLRFQQQPTANSNLFHFFV